MTRGRTSARAAVQAALQACETAQGLGAFWSIAAERALDHAERIDRERAGGARLGRLAGVGLAVKDNFDVSGLATTGGLPGPWVTASRDAAAVTALERAGAIAIGKTAMDPLGWSTHGEAPGFLPCLNPVDTSLSPGGSSAGSAAAVAAGVVPLGLGTDTAGSVRIPASYCGIVGLKPPWGEVSLERCLPLAPRFDTVGVLATSVRACAAGYQALTGAQLNAHAPARVGVLCDLMEQADPEVRSVCRSALRRLEASGVRLVECALDWRGRDFGCVLAVEIARTWGAAVRSEPERFPSDMRDAIASAAEVDEASFDKALARLEAAADGLGRRTGDVEAVLCPTVPVAVPEREQEKVEVSTRFTRPFSAMRWAAMSLPCGVDGVGRPVGLQVASGHGVPSVIAVGLGLEAAIG